MGKFSDFITKDMAERGMNQSQWARFCDIDQPLVNTWLKGGIPNPTNTALVKISDATSVPIEQIISLRDEDAVAKGKKSKGNIPQSARETVAMMNSPFIVGRSRDLPLRGLVAGGNMERVIFSGNEERGFVERPASLTGVGTAYALEVSGTSMIPRYLPDRDILHVNPGQAAYPGDFIVIQIKDPSTGETIGFVKELVKRDDKFITVKQYNPPKTIKFKAKEALVHLIVGTAEK
jgi:phage repressor protein C with HTH and peptisase S24 domain